MREYLSESLAKAGVTADVPIKKLRVEIHKGPEEDGRLYSWGEDQPGFQAGDYGDHQGLKVEVDGVVLYKDLRSAGDTDEIEEHDEACEECAKDPA